MHVHAVCTYNHVLLNQVRFAGLMHIWFLKIACVRDVSMCAGCQYVFLCQGVQHNGFLFDVIWNVLES